MFPSLFGSRCVMMFDPELVKQVLREPRHVLLIVDAATRQLIGEGSFVEREGQEHLSYRRLLTPSFHGEALEFHRRLILEATDRAIDSWTTERQFELLPSVRRLTLEVMIGVLLGRLEHERRDQLQCRFEALMHPVAGVSQRLRRTAPAVRDRRPVDELLHDEVARRRAAPGEHPDVLTTLLRAGRDDGAAPTDPEIADQLVTLLIAGSETTSAGLAWAFELLLRHPAVLERLKASLAGADEYLAAVVKETLRLRPPVANVMRRVGSEPYALGGYVIPPGTVIRVSLATVHRRADHYPDPLAFRPERFLDGDPAGDPVWLPFGAGIHRCLGASFATFEMQLVIRRVLERVRLRLVRRTPTQTAIVRFAQVPVGVRMIAEPLES
jgi:cytochrome P450